MQTLGVEPFTRLDIQSNAGRLIISNAGRLIIQSIGMLDGLMWALGDGAPNHSIKYWELNNSNAGLVRSNAWLGVESIKNAELIQMLGVESFKNKRYAGSCIIQQTLGSFTCWAFNDSNND